jgi:ABC-type branched-subunit amino acid transport system ATPase component/branched-subunit amino acid ABC-type transport system permease component
MIASVLLGLLDGLDVALLAIGLVLIFRSGRFINFAYAELGVIPMLLLSRLVLVDHLNWYVIFAAMLIFGCVVGGLSEFLLIRRLSKRSRFTVMVATIGLSQFLLAWTYFTWLPPPQGMVVSQGFPMPFNMLWTVQDLPVYSYNILTAIVVPAICGILYVFFKFTTTGKGIRAAASNPDAASLSGLPVERLSTITWIIAGGLSVVGAILTAPTYANFDPTSLGPELLLPALAAAAFAGFTSFPLAFVAALGLGVAEQVVNYLTGGSSDGELVLFFGALAALILRSKAIGLAGQGGIERVDGGENRIVIPPMMKEGFLVRRSTFFLAGIALAIGIAIPHLPFFGDPSRTFEVTQGLIFMLVVASVTVLAGWGGQLSLGQYAFAAVGGLLASRVAPHSWSLPAVFLFCGLIGGAVAVVIGLPALRYRGLALAVMTLAFAVLTSDWLPYQKWWSWFAKRGGGEHVPSLPGIGRITSVHSVYYLTLAIVGITFLGLAGIRRAGPGRAIAAVRDNPEGVAAIGVSPARVKMGLFALAGFVASIAGVLGVLSSAGASSAPDTSLLVVSIAVIGGLGSLPGVVLAAATLYLAPTLFSDYIKGILPESHQAQLLLNGLGLMLIILFLPGGFVQFWRDRWMQYLAWRERQMESRLRTSLEPPALGVATNRSPRRPAVASRPGGATPYPEPRSAAGHGWAGGEASSSQPALKAERVTVTFGPLRALSDVTLTVGAGEMVGLIGRNGSGKSTLINCVAGLVKPSSGALTMFGQDLTRRSVPARCRMGLGRTFQDARLFEGLSVREILQVTLLGNRYPGMVSSALQMPWVRSANADTAKRADAILESLGLLAYAETPARELSTGLRRITDLAIQVALRPKLLLLDEPTAGVAQREAEAFVPLLRRLTADLGTSVLIVEHDMPVILSVTDRIYCLELGQIIAEGEPDEIRQDPNVIASYLGTGDGVAVQRSGPLTASLDRHPARSSWAPAKPPIRGTENQW